MVPQRMRLPVMKPSLILLLWLYFQPFPQVVAVPGTVDSPDSK
jgi:hypothetical protein